MASLNGVTPGGWISYAQLLEEAGADGLELHLYHAASDMTTSAAEVERQAIEIVREVKRSVRIPVAVKLAPLLTAFAHFARQLDAAGADGLVLFTRFHRVDIDVEELEVDPHAAAVGFLGAAAAPARHRRAGRPRSRRRIAITGGVHTGLDVIKATMAGAHATQMVSALLRHGPDHLRTVRTRDRVVDAGARMELARRDARQHEPRADSRSRGVRTRELPDGAAMTDEHREVHRARRAAASRTGGVSCASSVQLPCVAGAARPLACRPDAGRPLSRAVRRARPAAAASGLRRQRHVRGVPRRQGDTLKGTAHAQAKNPRSPAATQGCESCHGPGQAHVDDDAKGQHQEVRTDQARRGQPDVPDAATTAATTRVGGQRARAPQSLVQHLPQRAQPEVAGAAARQGDRRPSSVRRATALQVTKTERAVAHMPVREGKMSCSLVP